MTPEQLKASILQFAVQGRLVEQVNEEGNAASLISELLCAKEGLIKNKIIKREKDIEEKELEPPFDIPDSWEWVRVADCVSNKSGLSYNKGSLEVRTDNMVRVLRGGNISDMSYSFKSDDVMIAKEYVKEDLLLKRNTLITPAVTSLEHIGKMGRIDKDYNDTVVGGFVLMLTTHIDNDILSRYLLIAFSSPYFRERCRKIVNKSGQAFYNLSREKMMQLFVPIPPLKEQERIVNKVNELLPYVGLYANSYNKIEILNSKFPEEMKKSILQFAVQGKLVEQISSEGDADGLYELIQDERNELLSAGKIKKDKPLTDILEDEIPFDIPETWKWVKMGKIFNIHSSKRVHAKDYTKTGVPFYRSMEVVCLAKGKKPDVQFYISEEQYQSFVDDGYIMPTKDDLLITCIGGSIGWSWVVDDSKFYYKDGNVVAFDCCKYVNTKYLYYWLNSFAFISKVKADVAGTAYNALTIDMLKNYILPLPPLEEQNRIVAKIEELLPLCDRLVR